MHDRADLRVDYYRCEGMVSLAPMLVPFLLLEPFLVSGLTSGAVKQ